MQHVVSEQNKLSTYGTYWYRGKCVKYMALRVPGTAMAQREVEIDLGACSRGSLSCGAWAVRDVLGVESRAISRFGFHFMSSRVLLK